MFFSINRAKKATLVKTVPPFVHHIAKHIDTDGYCICFAGYTGNRCTTGKFTLCYVFSLFLNMVPVVIMLI